jgi:hypothetical protein
VFHRGDGGGGIGLIAQEAALGIATAVLEPAPVRALAFEGASPEVRRSLRAARRRCRLYSLLRQLAEGLGLTRSRLSPFAASRAAALLLGRRLGHRRRCTRSATITPARLPGSAERAILLALARGEPMPASVYAGSALLDAADRHGLLPQLAHSRLSRELPPEVQRQLRARAVLNTARSQAAVDELVRLTNAFRAAGVPLLAWKGPILADQSYGEPWLRTFSDLDLIVAPGGLDRSEELLRQLGYQPARPVGDAQLRTLRRFNGERVFTCVGRPQAIDLHWRFAGASFPLPLSFDDAWQERVEWTTAAGPVSTLGPTHLAIATAAHAAKHLWCRLEALVAVGRLAQRQDLDWGAIDALARRFHVQRQLGTSFLLAERFLGASLPPLPTSLAASRSSLHVIASLVDANLFAPLPRYDAGPRDLRQLLDRRRDVVRALAVDVFVPTYPDWEAIQLPQAAHWLYWVIRPSRLAWKYLTRIVRAGQA